MSTIINIPRGFKFYGAVLALAALVVALLAVAYATGPAQAQGTGNDFGANNGHYQEPYPCGQGMAGVSKNPDQEFSEGHVALFDAYWDYESQTLNNNLCPPLAVHKVTRDLDGNVTGIVTARTESDIDVNTTVFHAGDDFKHTITTEEKAKYEFLPPAGTQVWWLKQDDPLAEAQSGGPEEPELVLGLSAGLFNKDDWYRKPLGDGEPDPDPLEYEFEAERDPEGNVIPFVVFENDANRAIWDSRNADIHSIPLKPGQYKHYNWVFFPGPGQRHTYVLEVHMKGHVRIDLPPGRTKEDWKPLTWPKNTPYDPANTFVREGINKTVTSQLRKQKYTIHVGPLHLNEQPRFGVLGEVQAGAAAGTLVGESIPMYGADRDQLHYTLEGDGHENFTVTESEGVHVGVNAQLVVADGAQLSYPDPDRPYYDLRLTVSDRHDHEDGSDQAIDDLIPVRIYVIPSSGPWITVAFRNEHPRVDSEIAGKARVMELPAGARISTLTAYYLQDGRRYSFFQGRGKADLKFYAIGQEPKTRNIFLEAVYQLNGETKTVSSAVYPITWRW